MKTYKKEITRKEMNFEFEKKEAVANAVHKKEVETQQTIADEKSRKQYIITWSVVVGLLLVIIFSLFVFQSLKTTRSQKIIIEEKQKDIIDSIRYAKRIQTSLLPTEKYIDKILNGQETNALTSNSKKDKSTGA